MTPCASFLSGDEAGQLESGDARRGVEQDGQGVGEERRTQSREMIQRQVDHMVRLVDDLLDVSRITRGKIQLQCEFAEIKDILNDAIETSRPLIDASAWFCDRTMVLPL